jgi:hypothetical protein
MFVAIIPSLNYIMPAIAGVIIWSVSGQINWKWAVLSYAASVLLSLFLVPEVEAKTFYILIFGYYPLLKELLHRKSGSGIFTKILRFFIKMAVFNATAVISYLIVVNVFGIGDVLDGLESFGEYAVYVFWGMGNIAFILYDFTLNYVFYAFLHWVKPVLNKHIRK